MNLNVRPETLKLLGEDAGKVLEVSGIGNDFLSRTSIAQEVRPRIDK
jgi:hypothetical protein